MIQSPVRYGTTRLGDESISRADRVAVAQEAMRKVGFLHTSDQYGSAQDVLREAAQGAMPPVVVKIGWESVEQIRGQVVKQNEALGIARMAVVQLCLGEPSRRPTRRAAARRFWPFVTKIWSTASCSRRGLGPRMSPWGTWTAASWMRSSSI